MARTDRAGSVTARAAEAHLAAVRAGAPGYEDPDSGLFVFTAVSLAAQGRCCGSGCRHCPYPIATGPKATAPTA